MKRKSDKRKLVVILTLIIVIIGISAFFLTRIPQRITANRFNKESDLPYNLLSNSGFSNANYGIIGGFGIKGYYDRKYIDGDDIAADFDESEKLRNEEIVIYWVSSYPDAVLGSSRITSIVCSDSAYSIFGCSAGDDVGKFSEALVSAGFKRNGYFSYTKCGVHIVLTPDDERSKVAYFTVSAEPGNIFKVRY